MSWNPMTQMPPDGVPVLVKNANGDVAVAVFNAVPGANGPVVSPSHMIESAGEVIGWQPCPAP